MAESLRDTLAAAGLPTRRANATAYRPGVADNLVAAYAIDAEAIARVVVERRLKELVADDRCGDDRLYIGGADWKVVAVASTDLLARLFPESSRG